jgi:ATP-binding cassette subfamily F protein 3
MRVALASLLFSQPDVLLLDEPSNHLDLEAVLWLEDFLKSYPATILLVSHERDFLNNVVDHILHLDRGKLTLYPGGYDAFERQRAERQAQLASARAKQQAEREKLQDYVARNSARASTAKQAQSRAKALAKMQPIAELLDDPTLHFDFPNPDELRPPLITLDMATVGYGETPILKRLNLRIDPDDRVALLGRFGFSGQKATTEVGKLSGGERARLALALITRDAPHMLILDEPTNHLDVDAREALIQALNAYTGTVVVVSHDRHMLEMTADRLVLVDQGTAKEFDGSLDDYIAFVLSKDGAAAKTAKVDKKEARRAAAEAREKGQELRKAAKAAEAEMAKLGEQRSAVERAMFDPATADAALTKLTMTELMKRRAELTERIDAAEAAWMEASEALEAIAA